MKTRARRKRRKTDFISKPGSTSGIKIVPVKKSHLKSIAKIYRQEYLRAPYHERWGPKGAVKRVRRLFRQNKGFAAMAVNGSGERGVAGFVFFIMEFWFGKQVGFIDELVVSKAFQHLGIGGALMERAIDSMRRARATEIYLLARRNGGPNKFYVRGGFSTTNYVLMKRRA